MTGIKNIGPDDYVEAKIRSRAERTKKKLWAEGKARHYTQMADDLGKAMLADDRTATKLKDLNEERKLRLVDLDIAQTLLFEATVASIKPNLLEEVRVAEARIQDIESRMRAVYYGR